MASKIHPTAVIDPGAEIGEDCEIGPLCVVGAGVVMGRANILKSHVVMEGPTTIGAENLFFPGAVIGAQPQDLKYHGEPTELIVGDRNVVRECVTLNRGTVTGGGKTTVGSNCLFMAYSHVAHDCHVGDHVILANSATLAGHVLIERCVTVGGLTPIQQFVRIGEFAFIGGATRVAQDIAPYVKMGGIPPTILGANSIGMKRRGVAEESVEAIDRVVRIFFRSGANSTQAVERIRAEVAITPEVAHFLEFVEAAKRGILR